MKSFGTAFVLAASAALVRAQVTYNPNGTYSCAVADAVYCAGDSLKTNIIIRCMGTVGQPGNCNPNLSGEPPVGSSGAVCYSPSVGEAACMKNCVVYGGSGNINGTFTLPDCIPTFTPSSSIPPSTLTTAGTSTATGTSTAAGTSTSPTNTNTGSAVTEITNIYTSTVSFCPSTGSTTVLPTTNGTITQITTRGPVPTTPRTTPPSTFTGAAVANQAGLGLAAAGLIAAHFL